MWNKKKLWRIIGISNTCVLVLVHQSIPTDRLWPFAICLKWKWKKMGEWKREKTETLSSYRGKKFFSSSSLLLFGQNQKIFFFCWKKTRILLEYIYIVKFIDSINKACGCERIIITIMMMKFCRKFFPKFFFLLLLLLLMLWK